MTEAEREATREQAAREWYDERYRTEPEQHITRVNGIRETDHQMLAAYAAHVRAPLVEALRRLSTEDRQELYTLMHQWARSTDLQFQQVTDWIDKRAERLLREHGGQP